MRQLTEAKGRASILDISLSRLLSRVSWEAGAYLAILAVAVLLRFWDLGRGVLHHDEVTHAWDSWNLYSGRGYTQSPAFHGPILYHLNALAYFFLGVSDYTARVSTALAGLMLVGLPCFMRRWLGRSGALIASVFLAISPSLLYYSRHLRHDIFLVLGTLALVIATFRYLEEGKERDLYLAIGALAFAFTTTEVYFIVIAILGSFLFLCLVWEWLKGQRVALEGPYYDLVIAIGTLCLPFASPLLTFLVRGRSQWLPPTPEDWESLLLTFAISAAVGLRWNRKRWLKCLLIFYAVFIPLYTTFLYYSQGLLSGLIGSLGHWLSQQDVRRGGQPWFYYLVLVPMYEFTPLIFALGAAAVSLGRGIRRTREPQISRRLDQFLIYWAILIGIALSWAGEKMPWLAVHIALPLVLLAARFIGPALDSLDWGEVRRKGGLHLLYLLPLSLFLFSIWIRLRPRFLLQGRSLQKLAETAQWMVGLAVLATLLWMLLTLLQRLGLKRATQVALASAVLVLSLFTFRYSWMASFAHSDVAVEMLVYTQSTPQVAGVMREIEALSRRLRQGEERPPQQAAGLAGDPKEMPIAYDNEANWPFIWYLLGYPDVHYFGDRPSQPLEEPIVIVGLSNDEKVRPYLGDRYIGQRYKLRWWFPEERYRGLTPRRTLETLRDPALRHSWWRLAFYREVGEPLGSTDFILYIRKDLAEQVFAWKGEGPAGEEKPSQALEARRVEARVELAFGKAGSGPDELLYPKGLALDDQERLYVVDSGNHRLQVFDANPCLCSAGQYLFGWGKEGSGPGEFKGPWGIAVAEGRVYVADTWNHRIQVFDSEGKYLDQWGAGTLVDSGGRAERHEGGFYGPRDIAIHKGKVYVSDTGNKRVQVFTMDGEFVGQFGGYGIGTGKLNEPVGIEVSVEGEVYIADTWNRRVQVFDQGGKYRRGWKVPGWEGEGVDNKPYVAVGLEGEVYLTDPVGHRVLRYTSEGELAGVWGRLGVGEGELNLPVGIVVDGEGRIYIADSGNHRIVRYAPVE